MRTRIATSALFAALLAAGCASNDWQMTGQQVRLWGSNEVPPNTTMAYGTGTVNVTTDRYVAVTLSVIDMAPTAAHIHEGAAGANGPVIVPLQRISANAFTAAPNAQLTEAQYQAYIAGNLYVNVHSEKYPGGEVRAQIVGRK
jgi:hypothetical protein